MCRLRMADRIETERGCRNGGGTLYAAQGGCERKGGLVPTENPTLFLHLSVQGNVSLTVIKVFNDSGLTTQ
jgi:hypothetical protein